MKIYYKIKTNYISIFFLLFTLFLLIYSRSSFISAKSGLKLWANIVVPSLFPFFVAAELLSYTNIVNYLSKKLHFLMRPLFNIPGEAAFAFILGIISGYPVGAHIVCNLYKNNSCTKDEAERMLFLCNNSGPLFIIGTVGISFYSSATIGFILLFTHILSSITIGIIYGFLSKLQKQNKNLS